MKLVSVNVGRIQAIENAKSSGISGIFKMPCLDPVEITQMGLLGDVICDTENHGGIDQAVYIFGTTDYEWWSKELGFALAPGTFGENLTISTLESASYSIGDRLRVGEALLEVTAPRIPCVTLAARMGDPAFVKRFRHAERPGLYCRVLETGQVQVGNSVTVELSRSDSVKAVEMFRLFYEDSMAETTLRRLLALPIAIRARRDYERQLASVLNH
jgi:MOSC domain-containing protein YiiM